MTHLLRVLRATAAACLLLVARAALADLPAPSDVAVASVQSAYARAVKPGEQADLHRQLFATVLQRLHRSYATEVDLTAFAAAASKVMEPLAPGSGDPAEVFGKAINTALRTLDPYSRYLDARTVGNERSESSGSFVGLGLQVESGEGAVRVLAPIPGGPAERAGVQPGDVILRVDDQLLSGLPLADAIARMRGQAGTPVSLTIRRTGLEGEITVALTRGMVRRHPVRWSMEGDVLVLRVATFSAAVTSALQQAVADAAASGAPRGVVLDLRGNPGGLLREAVTLADAFLNQGDIVSLRGRTPNSQRSWKADPAELLPGVRLVVLIDRRSASASELVAAALQENGRATVMGQRSFGKGTVQSTYPLGDEARGALKLTTSLYLAPSGRSVQRSGVMPDIELLLPLPAPGTRTDETRPEAAADAAQPQLPRLQVEQGRCPAMQKAAPDPALSCAIAYLAAGDMDRFQAQVSAPSP